MKSLLLAALLLTAVPRQEIVYHIYFKGKIVSKEYVVAKTPSGAMIKVPVINGFVPEMQEQTDRSGVVVHRHFWYNTRIQFRRRSTPLIYQEKPSSSEIN